MMNEAVHGELEERQRCTVEPWCTVRPWMTVSKLGLLEIANLTCKTYKLEYYCVVFAVDSRPVPRSSYRKGNGTSDPVKLSIPLRGMNYEAVQRTSKRTLSTNVPVICTLCSVSQSEPSGSTTWCITCSPSAHKLIYLEAINFPFFQLNQCLLC